MILNNIAIILARGNSKRLPRKNILPLNGKPLIYWSIKAAIESKIFDKVLVSTDNKEIAYISKKFGAEVPFLRNSGADDFTPSSEATFIALSQAEDFYGCKFKYVCQMMANCPLRNSTDIVNSFKTFVESQYNSQISCFKYGWMNPWWAFKLNSNLQAEKIFPEALNKRSQDLPELYCPTGAIWFAKRNAFIKTKNFYMQKTRYEPLDWTSAVDIDDINDFFMAEVILELKNRKD